MSAAPSLTRAPARGAYSNSLTAAFVVGTNRALRITSGADCVYFLTKSTRIAEDLNCMTQFGEQHFGTVLVLREW